MRTRIVIAFIVLAEAMVLWTHPAQARHFMRRVYVACWHVMPSIDGVEIPDRFADPK